MTTEGARRLEGIQGRIEAYYGLERAPAVGDFVRYEAGVRETTLVRQTADGLDLAVVLPASAERATESIDELLQVVEGVSHFLLLAERARRELPATQLELELQAEVDKFVVLVLAEAAPARRDARRWRRRASRVHEALYARVTHLHAAGTEAGHRYRLANDLAARMTRRILDRDDPEGTRALLRRFYRVGQAEKIRVASALRASSGS